MMERLRKARQNPRTADEIRQWEWDNEVSPRLRDVQLPERFRHEITNWNCKPQQRTFDLCRRLLTGKGAIVALIGVRGTGKTSIAAQLIIERAKAYFERPQQWPAPYSKLTDLISRFKPIYADHGSIDGDKVMRQRDAFCSYPLRVIDEIHECDDQRMKTRVLTDLIDRCYSGLVDTLIISNQTQKEFEASTSDSVISRINEHGRIIECTWESHRTKL